MTNVSVTVTAPAHFVQNQSSQLGPVSIARGESHTFQLDYTISQDASEGEFTATLRTNQDTEFVTNRNVETSVLGRLGFARAFIVGVVDAR